MKLRAVYFAVRILLRAKCVFRVPFSSRASSGRGMLKKTRRRSSGSAWEASSDLRDWPGDSEAPATLDRLAGPPLEPFWASEPAFVAMASSSWADLSERRRREWKRRRRDVRRRVPASSSRRLEDHLMRLTGTEISLARRSNGAIEAVGERWGGSAEEKAVRGPRRRPVSRLTADRQRRAGWVWEAAGGGADGAGRQAVGERMWEAWAMAWPAEGNVVVVDSGNGVLEGRERAWSEERVRSIRARKKSC